MKYIAIIILCSTLSVQSKAQCTANTKSILLGGITSYVSFTNSTNLTLDSTVTLEAWIKPSSFGASSFTNSIICKHSSSQGKQGYVIRCGGTGQLSFAIAGTDSSGLVPTWQEIISPINTLSLNTWQHVAGVYDGDSLKIYLNTIEIGATAFRGSIVPSTAFPLCIGRWSEGSGTPSRFFSGQIDEARIWNRALSRTEILAGYNRHISPTSTGLVGYWNFNVASGTNIPDQTSSGNTGTLISGSLSTNVPFYQGSLTPVITANGINLTSTSATTYQWNYNGQPILTGTTQSYTATQNGTYTVTIVDSIGCPATSAPVIITGVGIQEINNSNNLLVKNLSNSIEIEALNATKIASAQIFNSTGSLVAEEQNQETTVSFNKSNFAKGIYIINVSTDKGMYQSRVAIQ